MLRAELGESAYWIGLRNYYQAHKYSTVTTDNLESALEASAGQDLGAWFDQWVDRPGNPTVYAAWNQVGRQVSVRLCQAGEPFALPITIAAHGGAESRRAAGRLDGAEAALDVNVPFEADGVTVDPDFALLADTRVVHVMEATLPGCGELIGGF
jgi:aminopeptidase N